VSGSMMGAGISYSGGKKLKMSRFFNFSRKESKRGSGEGVLYKTCATDLAGD